MVQLRFGSIPLMLNSVLYFGAGRRWTLEQWLTACHGRKASDLRDLAYAGLSVLDPAELYIDQ